MSKHTPAPWIAEDNWLSGNIDIVSEEREFIVSVYPDSDTELAKIDKANAKLIALSPIMYNYLYKKSQEGCEEAKNILSTLD